MEALIHYTADRLTGYITDPEANLPYQGLKQPFHNNDEDLQELEKLQFSHPVKLLSLVLWALPGQFLDVDGNN